MLKYPKDAHKLPRMEHGYICFPDWAYRRTWSLALLSVLGDIFFGGKYCFTVDRNKEPGY